MSSTEQKQKAQVQQQLQKMSENPTFSNGGRMYALLVYLVNSELEGKGRLLNQTSLAIDVFDRDENFDPNSDSIVRVEVGRLRNKLREYYALAGKNDLVRISIPKGRYIPAIDIDNPHTDLPAQYKPWWKSNSAFTLAGIIFLSGLWLFLSSDRFKGEPITLNPLSNSVSILPFENLSPDPDNAFYSVAVQEAIQNQLQASEAINLLPAESQTLIQGSVKIENNLVLVQVQLVEAASRNILWSGFYEPEIAEIFNIRADVVANIAATLNSVDSVVEISSFEKQPSNHPEAFAFYLKARSSQEPGNRQGYLDQALAIDPDFALAHATKAFLYSRSMTDTAFGPAVAESEWEQTEALFRYHAEKALKLEPGMALAKIAQANFYLYTWRWDQAREIYEQVENTEPNFPHLITYVFLDTYTENYTTAIERLEALIKANPNSPVFYSLLGGILSAKGDYDAAADSLRIGLNDAVISYSALLERNLLVNVEISRGNDSLAYQELQLLEQLGADKTAILPSMIYSYYRLEREEDVKRLYFQFEEMAAAGHIFGEGSWAEVYFALGQHEKSLAALRLVVEKVKRNEPDKNFVSLMAFLDKVTSDPVLNSQDFIGLHSQFIDLRKKIIFN